MMTDETAAKSELGSASNDFSLSSSPRQLWAALLPYKHED